MNYEKVKLKIHTIKKGEHLARDQFGQKVRVWTWYNHNRLKELEYVVQFRAGTIPDYKDDADEYDWHKGGGFALDWIRNDEDSLMWAWSSRFSSNTILLTGYMNRDGGRETGDSQPMQARQFERVYIRLRRDGKGSRRWNVYMRNLATGDEYTENFKTAKNGFWFFGRWSRRIPAPYHGGADNSPGPFGGVAPQDMDIALWYNSKNYH